MNNTHKVLFVWDIWQYGYWERPSTQQNTTTTVCNNGICVGSTKLPSQKVPQACFYEVVFVVSKVTSGLTLSFQGYD